MWGGYEHMGNLGLGFGFGFGWVFQLVFWALIIWLIVYLVKNHNERIGSGQGKSDDAMEILRKRYAKGEITKEQFEQMKNDLQ